MRVRVRVRVRASVNQGDDWPASVALSAACSRMLNLGIEPHVSTILCLIIRPSSGTVACSGLGLG